jgi:hypothetical protein
MLEKWIRTVKITFNSNFRFGNFKVYKSILESRYSCFLRASLAKKAKAEIAELSRFEFLIY